MHLYQIGPNRDLSVVKHGACMRSFLVDRVSKGAFNRQGFSSMYLHLSEQGMVEPGELSRTFADN